MTLKTGYKARHETYIFFSSFSIFFVLFFVSVSVSVSVSLRFGRCFVASFFPFFFLFACSLSLQARRPVAAVAGHSLVQLNPQEGDRTDTWLGGLFVPSTKNKVCTLYLFNTNTSRSFLSRPLWRVVKRRSIDPEQPFVPLINSAVSCG